MKDDVVLISLEQDKHRKEKENINLRNKLESYKKEIPKCLLGKYTIQNRNGIYEVTDSKGNIIKESDIEDVMEKKIFSECYFKLSAYNGCYNQILINENEIEDINKSIERRKDRLGM